MNLLKKLLPFLSLALICAAYSFAVPGVTQQIADTSGEYAFYKDSSFNRTSYIGIIYYNDSTYAFHQDTKSINKAVKMVTASVAYLKQYENDIRIKKLNEDF